MGMILMSEQLIEAAEELLPEEVAETVHLDALQQFLQDLPNMAIAFGLKVVLSLITVFIGVRLINLLRALLKKSALRANIDKGIISFLDSCCKFSLYVVLAFLVGMSFGLNAATVAAILGSVGVALGLAVQGGLTNFAGGLLILIAKPFEVGDYIITSNAEGTVYKVEVLYTKLLSVDDKIVIIPNGELSNSQIINVTAMDKRKAILNLSISYNSDIKKAREILLKMLEECDLVLQNDEKMVAVEELADSGVILRLQFWTNTNTFRLATWQVLEAAKYALDAGGIEIPFPQMDVHLTKKEISL